MARQTFRGGWLSDTIDGSPGDDDIFGYESNDTLYGGMGIDTLDGGTGADRMHGGLHDDTYIVDNAGDVVIEDSGANSGIDAVISSISYKLPANVERLLFRQDPNAVTGDGNDLDNYISGNRYNNVLYGRGGADTLYGYEGRDAIYGGSGIDVIYGGEDNDRLYGEGEADTLYGDAGDDELDGGSGADTMYGGLNNDTYFVQNDFDQVIEYSGQGRDTVFSALGTYTLTANVEDMVIEGASAFHGTGNALNNQIVGNGNANDLSGMDGDDTLYGMEGDDWLSGGLGGTDHLHGGLGNDTYLIRDTLDVVHEAANEGIDTVTTTVSYALGANVENLTLAFGSTGIGNAQVNTITGNAYANTLDGLGGADTLIGRGGDDTYVVDNAGDVVTEVAGEGFDAVVASVSYTLAANTSIESLHTTFAGGTGAINLTGNGFANTVVGNNGANVIDGGAGNDTLTGNGGADSFRFNTLIGPGINTDTITDFNVADDTIQLENAIFAGLPTSGNLARNLSSAEFRIGSAAQDADDRIIYNSQTGAVLYDADGNGAGAAVQFLTIGAGLAVTTADFLVI